MAGIIVFVVIGAGACVALIAAAIGVFISIVWVPLSLSPALSIAAINLTWTGVYQDLHWHPLFSIFSANIAGLLGFCLPWILTFMVPRCSGWVETCSRGQAQVELASQQVDHGLEVAH